MGYHDTDQGVTPEFAEGMLLLAEAFGARLSTQRIQVYARALGDIPWPDVQLAMGQAVRGSKYMPTVAELRALAGEPGPDDAALVAWAALDRAARQVGAYASLELDDPAAAAALRAVWGSWGAYCGEDEGPALAAKRSAFLAAYRAARARHPRVGHARLPGLCEAAGELAPGGLVGRITGGRVAVGTERLIGGGHATRAIAAGQGTDAGTAEGEAEARRGEAGPGGQAPGDEA